MAERELGRASSLLLQHAEPEGTNALASEYKRNIEAFALDRILGYVSCVRLPALNRHPIRHQQSGKLSLIEVLGVARDERESQR